MTSMIGTRCLCLMYLKSFLFSFFSFSTKEKKKYIQYIYTILSREERVEGNGITCSKRVRHLMIHHLTLEGNFISKKQNLTCFFPCDFCFLEKRDLGVLFCFSAPTGALETKGSHFILDYM